MSCGCQWLVFELSGALRPQRAQLLPDLPGPLFCPNPAARKLLKWLFSSHQANYFFSQDEVYIGNGWGIRKHRTSCSLGQRSAGCFCMPPKESAIRKNLKAAHNAICRSAQPRGRFWVKWGGRSWGHAMVDSCCHVGRKAKSGSQKTCWRS